MYGRFGKRGFSASLRNRKKNQTRHARTHALRNPKLGALLCTVRAIRTASRTVHTFGAFTSRIRRAFCVPFAHVVFRNEFSVSAKRRGEKKTSPPVRHYATRVRKQRDFRRFFRRFRHLPFSEPMTTYRQKRFRSAAVVGFFSHSFSSPVEIDSSFRYRPPRVTKRPFPRMVHRS